MISNQVLKRYADLGIIDSHQIIIKGIKNYETSIGKLSFNLIPINYFYLLNLKNTDNYLSYYNHNLEIVKKKKGELFEEWSKFFILSDGKICSILPANHHDYILTVQDGILKIKKYFTLLDSNSITIFMVNKVIINNEKRVEKPKPNISNNKKKSDLININKLDKCFMGNMTGFIIVTPKYSLIPEDFKKYAFYQSNINIHTSLLYLEFIIDAYDSDYTTILFIDKFSLIGTNLYKLFYQGKTSKLISNLDGRITMDGYRIKYKKGGQWGDWNDLYKKNNKNFINFMIKIMRKLPNSQTIDFSQNLFYFLPIDIVRNRSLEYYKTIKKNILKKKYPIHYLDKLWNVIFTI